MIDFSKSYNPLTPEFPPEIFQDIYTYSDTDYLDLKAQLARTFHRDSSDIIVDNASSAVIEKILSHYHDSVIFREQDFFVFDNIANAYHQKIEKISRNNFLENLDIHLSSVYKSNVLVLFSIVNNYESSLIPLDDIYRVALKYPKVSFVLDGAYFEYTQLPYSVLNGLLSLPNVSYMSTLSKAYGLAGLRVGYLISNQIKKFYPIEIKYKVASVGCRMASYLLKDPTFFNQTLTHFKNEKTNLVEAGLVATDAHKVLYIARDTAPMIEHLAKHEITPLPILLDNTDNSPALAFSIASAQSNEKLINALKDFK